MPTQDQINQWNTAAQDALSKGADPEYVKSRLNQLMSSDQPPINMDRANSIKAAAQDALDKGADPAYVSDRLMTLLGTTEQQDSQTPTKPADRPDQAALSPGLAAAGVAVGVLPIPGAPAIGGVIQKVGSMSPDQLSTVAGAEGGFILGRGINTLNLAKAGADLLDYIGVKNKAGAYLGDVSKKAQSIYETSDWYKNNPTVGNLSLEAGKNALPVVAGMAIPAAKLGGPTLNSLSNLLSNSATTGLQAVGNSPDDQASNFKSGAILGGATYGALSGIGKLGSTLVGETAQDLLSKIPLVGTHGYLKKQGAAIADKIDDLAKQYETQDGLKSAAYASMLNKIGPDTIVPRNYADKQSAMDLIDTTFNTITRGQPINALSAEQKVAYKDFLDFIKSKEATSFSNSWDELRDYGTAFGKVIKSEYNVSAPGSLSKAVTSAKWRLLKGQMDDVAKSVGADVDWAAANVIHQKDIMQQSLVRLIGDSLNPTTGHVDLNKWANNANKFLDNNTPLAIQKTKQQYVLPTDLKDETQQAIKNIVKIIKENPKAVKALSSTSQGSLLSTGGVLSAGTYALNSMGIPILPALFMVGGATSILSKMVSTPSIMSALGKIGSHGKDFKKASSLIINGLLNDQKGTK